MDPILRSSRGCRISDMNKISQFIKTKKTRGAAVAVRKVLKSNKKLKPEIMWSGVM